MTMPNHSARPTDGKAPKASRQERELANTELQAASGIIHKMADLSRELKHATATLEKILHDASGSNALTLLHGVVLATLWNTSPCKQVDLKAITSIAPAYLTRLVDELVDQRLVHRHRSSWDRRQIILALTGPGKESAYRVLTSLSQSMNETHVSAITDLRLSLDRFIILMQGHPAPLQPMPQIKTPPR
jgi:DNA-binding MarR family transcriptional regulator